MPLLVLAAPRRRLPVPSLIARQHFRFAEEELESHFHGVVAVFTVAPPAREALGVMVTVHTVPCRCSSSADQNNPGGQILHGPLGENASGTPCAAAVGTRLRVRTVRPP